MYTNHEDMIRCAFTLITFLIAISSPLSAQHNLGDLNENGTLKIESNLTGDPWELTGITSIYTEEGRLKTETTVSMGKLVKSISWDEQGRVTNEETDGHSISYWYEKDTGKRHVVIDGKPQD